MTWPSDFPSCFCSSSQRWEPERHPLCLIPKLGLHSKDYRNACWLICSSGGLRILSNVFHDDPERMAGY
eukprot:scaffold113259_cov39-Prasinocladus_malaysianus.AAC.1